jgi:acetyl-CoA carboxylase biotin carboxyl carrier protein
MREKEIMQLIRILEANENIAEIEMAIYPFGARKIRVSRAGDTGGGMLVRSQPGGAAPAPAPVEEALPAQTPSDLHPIKAPMVGTFYRAPSPEAEPFVSEGSRISPGSVLCIIEAMKLMNEIESDVSGTVREINVENGQAIEFGQVLFLIERD